MLNFVIFIIVNCLKFFICSKLPFFFLFAFCILCFAYGLPFAVGFYFLVCIDNQVF